MSLKQRDLYIRNIFSTIAPQIDFLTSGFSFGFDHIWRAKAVSLSGIHEGDRVLDVCSGTGELAFRLSRRVGPTGSVTGADFCEEMLERAKIKAGTRHQNTTFVLADAKNVPFPDNTFDAVTVAFGMRNIPDTCLALEEIKRVLKPGGTFICLELTSPNVPLFRTIYKWYVSRIMPFCSKLIVKTAKPYVYLPRSINAFYSPDKFKKVIGECGFSNVTIDSLTMGIATIYKAVKYA